MGVSKFRILPRATSSLQMANTVYHNNRYQLINEQLTVKQPLSLNDEQTQ
jgi:hypothetical protein